MSGTPLQNADALAIELEERVLTFSHGQASFGVDLSAVISGSVDAALAQTEPHLLVTALVGHLIAAVTMLDPQDPHAAFEQLKQLVTLNRLEGWQ